LGDRKGIQPVKTEQWGAGVAICLERVADLHMAQLMPLPLPLIASCFSKIQIGFTRTFLVPAHLGSPRQWTVKRVCVRKICENRNDTVTEQRLARLKSHQKRMLQYEQDEVERSKTDR